MQDVVRKDRDKIRMKKLNIGCGKDIRKGFVNLDFIKLDGIDVVWDLNKYPYPFENNTFDYVSAEHVMEHLDEPLKPLEELWRICKNKAIIHIIVPNYNSYLATIDLTHKHFYNYETYSLNSVDGPAGYYTNIKYRVKNRYVKGVRCIPNITFKVWLSKIFGNIVTDLIFELEVIK